MKSPKFQVGEVVQTAEWWDDLTPPTKATKGVIKYRYYRSPGGGVWFYIVQPIDAHKYEGIAYREDALELSLPPKVVHCCCCKNSNVSYPLSKFHKGQKVSTIKYGRRYFGKINCVIDMKTYYDYYVDCHGHPTMDCDSTMRCNEKELCCCSCCCCHCHCV